ncbi:MAG TPA: hypothetical protein PLN21_08265 [Gemmatales bacterium]|nr:hypothetical protein [Gemmatales bacterium]
MNSRILMYSAMCVLWLGLAGAIFMGFHEEFLGRAEDWKKYLAIGICALMICFNLLRIIRIRQADARARQTHDQPS